MSIVYRELSSLTNDLGVTAHTLYSVSNHIDKHYHKKKILKKDGNERELLVPDKLLKVIQKKIVNKLLCYEETSVYAKAYKYGSSIAKNAKPHIKKPAVLKLDIKKFFDNITYSMVKEKVFINDKYSENSRILLSILCTFRGRLPQGAPSSPIISNIIMKHFDEEVAAWCAKNKIIYTRYCDDMTFSGDFDASEAICFVSKKLNELGFSLNDKKTKFVRCGQKQIVTGIVVNDKLNVPIEYRKEIRQNVYYCKKFGVKSHLSNQKINQHEVVFLRSLLGKINYVLSVNGENLQMLDYKNWVMSELNKY